MRRLRRPLLLAGDAARCRQGRKGAAGFGGITGMPQRPAPLTCFRSFSFVFARLRGKAPAAGLADALVISRRIRAVKRGHSRPHSQGGQVAAKGHTGTCSNNRRTGGQTLVKQASGQMRSPASRARRRRTGTPPAAASPPPPCCSTCSAPPRSCTCPRPRATPTLVGAPAGRPVPPPRRSGRKWSKPRQDI